MRIRMPKKPIPSAKKIAKRGLYEMMWKCGKEDYKPRNYEKKMKEGKY